MASSVQMFRSGVNHESLDILRGSKGLQKAQLKAMRKTYELLRQVVPPQTEQEELDLLRGSSGLQTAQLEAMRKRYETLEQRVQQFEPETMAAASALPVASKRENLQVLQQDAAVMALRQLDVLRGSSGFQTAQLAAMRRYYEKLGQASSPHTSTPLQMKQNDLAPVEEARQQDVQVLQQDTAVAMAREELDVLRGCSGLQTAQLAAMRRHYEKLGQAPSTHSSTPMQMKQNDLVVPEEEPRQEDLQVPQQDTAAMAREELDVLRGCSGLQTAQLAAMRRHYESLEKPNESPALEVLSLEISEFGEEERLSSLTNRIEIFLAQISGPDKRSSAQTLISQVAMGLGPKQSNL